MQFVGPASCDLIVSGDALAKLTLAGVIPFAFAPTLSHSVTIVTRRLITECRARPERSRRRSRPAAEVRNRRTVPRVPACQPLPSRYAIIHTMFGSIVQTAPKTLTLPIRVNSRRSTLFFSTASAGQIPFSPNTFLHSPVRHAALRAGNVNKFQNYEIDRSRTLFERGPRFRELSAGPGTNLLQIGTGDLRQPCAIVALLAATRAQGL